MNIDKIREDLDNNYNRFEELGGYNQDLQEAYLDSFDADYLIDYYCKVTFNTDDIFTNQDKAFLINELLGVYDFYSDDDYWEYLESLR